MVWFKVDDNLAFHQKTLRAGNAAMGMWVRAGSECASQLTDGFVGDELVKSLGGHKLAAKLVDANLWLRVDGGYQFWQWGEEGRQPSRADVEAKRKEAADRQRRARDRAKSQRDAERESQRDIPSDADRDDPVTHTEVFEQSRSPRPDPTRPVVVSTSGENRNGTLPATNATDRPPVCSRHPSGNPLDEPCAGCARVRAWHEQQDELDQARRREETERARSRAVAAELEKARREATPPPADWRALATAARKDEAP